MDKIKIKRNDRLVKEKIHIFTSLLLVACLVTNFLYYNVSLAATDSEYSNDPEIIKLNQQVEEKQKQIDEINRQKAIYQQNIDQRQREAINLKNQMELLENEIAKIALEVPTTELEIDKTNLEIKDYQNRIIRQEEEIMAKKEKLSEVIRQLYKNKRQDSFLEILVMNDSLGSFFDQVSKLEDVQVEIKNGVDELKTLKGELEVQKTDLENKNTELNKLKDKLTSDQEKLENDKRSKESIYLQTKGEELKFQGLYNKLIKEQRNINETIQDLEIQTRKKILQFEGLKANENGVIWPVPSRMITTTFHDPDYPFRYVYEHPGIDVGQTPQGTPVRASASGYVAIAKNGGLYGYSYIMIVHANGLSTVYGHISQITAKVDTYVVQGEVIGASGGMPGTPGAGYMTTGPHLHFELRSNGIPVDPLQYLP